MGSLRWHGDAVQGRIRAEMKRRISYCCLLVLNWAKQLINVEGTAKSKAAGKRNAKGQFLKGSGKLAYGANPSKPGEPPHKQTGRLLGSVAFEVSDDLEGRVGTNLKYGRWLELGTRLMAARPWLRRALKECQAQILAVLKAPMRGP
jgi:hypothetical protein